MYTLEMRKLPVFVVATCRGTLNTDGEGLELLEPRGIDTVPTQKYW